MVEANVSWNSCSLVAVPMGDDESVCTLVQVLDTKLYVPGVVVMLLTLIACSSVLEARDSRTYNTVPSRLGTADVAVPDVSRSANLTVGVVPPEFPGQVE